MASKTTLNAKNLEALGAERLAQLLIEISTGNAAAKRKLRLALAGAQSPREAAREIAKRLTSIAKGKSTINWKKRNAFVDDLQTLRRGIVDQVAPQDPGDGLFLMWRFMSLANPVIERCHGADDAVIRVFHDACADLGALASAAEPRRDLLVDMMYDALNENAYGQYKGLISVLAPVLGEQGLDQLRQRFDALMNELAQISGSTDGSRRESTEEYVARIASRRKQRNTRRALLELADVQGDVDGFIAQFDPDARTIPAVAIEIARRLLGADRAAEALKIIDAADVDEDDYDLFDWQDVRIDSLEALGRSEEVQAFRWTCFEQHLSADYLRDYLKRLADFDDIEAEERAMMYAMSCPSLFAALRFFLDWSSPALAAQLLVSRHEEIDGDHYEILVPAAESLSERHPLAATLALRAMIDFTLMKARSKRYSYAADHLVTCGSLAPAISDFGAFETHEAYVTRLKKVHAHKLSFWSRLDG
jgi:hypothetical protein